MTAPGTAPEGPEGPEAQGGWGGITPERCAGELMEAVPLVMRFIRAEMRRRGGPSLSVVQFRALAFLDRHPGAPLSDVADHLGVARPTASTVVDRLVRQGLVVRAEDPRERRRVSLTLSAAGAQLLRQAREATRARVAEVLAGLPAEQLRTVAAAAALLARAFREVAGRDGR